MGLLVGEWTNKKGNVTLQICAHLLQSKEFNQNLLRCVYDIEKGQEAVVFLHNFQKTAALAIAVFPKAWVGTHQ